MLGFRERKTIRVCIELIVYNVHPLLLAYFFHTQTCINIYFRDNNIPIETYVRFFLAKLNYHTLYFLSQLLGIPRQYDKLPSKECGVHPRVVTFSTISSIASWNILEE